MNVKKQLVKVDSKARRIGKYEPELKIEIMNTLAGTNSFELDVVFIGKFNPGPNAQLFVRKLLKFNPTLAPMEKQTITANSILWFDSHKETNAVFPRGNAYSEHEGWIIRASRDGVVLKTVTSGPAMDRLAADSFKLASLLQGGAAPVK